MQQSVKIPITCGDRANSRNVFFANLPHERGAGYANLYLLLLLQHRRLMQAGIANYGMLVRFRLEESNRLAAMAACGQGSGLKVRSFPLASQSVITPYKASSSFPEAKICSGRPIHHQYPKANPPRLAFFVMEGFVFLRVPAESCGLRESPLLPIPPQLPLSSGHSYLFLRGSSGGETRKPATTPHL